MTGSEGEWDAPLGFFLSGGQWVGEWTRGFDAPPRAFTAEQTTIIADEIDRLAEETMVARFDWPEMMRRQVYPEIALQEKVPPELWAAYREQFDHLKDFLRATAGRSQGFAISYR